MVSHLQKRLLVDVDNVIKNLLEGCSALQAAYFTTLKMLIERPAAAHCSSH